MNPDNHDEQNKRNSVQFSKLAIEANEPSILYHNIQKAAMNTQETISQRGNTTQSIKSP